MAGLRRSATITAVALFFCTIAMMSKNWQYAAFSILEDEGVVPSIWHKVIIKVGLRSVTVRSSTLTDALKSERDLDYDIGSCDNFPSTSNAKENCDALGKASTAAFVCGILAILVGFVGLILPFIVRKRHAGLKIVAHRILILCANIVGFLICLGAVLYSGMTYNSLPGAYGAPQSLSWSYVLYLASGCLAFFAGGTFFVAQLEMFNTATQSSHNARVPNRSVERRLPD